MRERSKKVFAVEKHVNDERLESVPFSYCMHAFLKYKFYVFISINNVLGLSTTRIFFIYFMEAIKPFYFKVQKPDL